jgi:5-methylcytosine-specific restriction endonuclease McrA
MKQCSRCKKLKPLEEFHKNKSREDGHQCYCKECMNEFSKGSKRRHIEKVKAYNKQYNIGYRTRHNELQKEWVKKHHEQNKLTRRISEQKRRAKQDVLIPIEQINDLINKAKNICFWCGNTIKQNDMQLDHVYPLSKGGKHDISNLVVSCRKCNNRKSNKHPEDWMNELFKSEMAG